MLGTILLWLATIQSENRYPDALTLRLAGAATPEIRRQFVEAARRANLHSPIHETIDVNDAEAFIGVVCIMRGRAIGKKIEGDPAWRGW